MSLPQVIYYPVMAMGFSAMFTFQLENTKRFTKHCLLPIAVMGVVDTFRPRQQESGNPNSSSHGKLGAYEAEAQPKTFN